MLGLLMMSINENPHGGPVIFGFICDVMLIIIIALLIYDARRKV